MAAGRIGLKERLYAVITRWPHDECAQRSLRRSGSHASGGLAHRIAPYSRYIAEIDDMLTLEGLPAVGWAADP